MYIQIYIYVYIYIYDDTCAWTPNKIKYLARLSTGASREAPVDNERLLALAAGLRYLRYPRYPSGDGKS